MAIAEQPTELLTRSTDAREAFAALYTEMNAAFDRIDSSIRLAGKFEVFSIKLHGLRALKMPGTKFVMEWSDDHGAWLVGYRAKPRSGAQTILVKHAKLDGAVNLLFEAWQLWAKEEREKLNAQRDQGK